MDMFQFIRRQYGDISVCVYSAGVAHVATLLEGKTEDWRDMFEVRQQWLCILFQEWSVCISLLQVVVNNSSY